MDVAVHIDIDEWYPVYVPEDYDEYYNHTSAKKIVVDQSLLDRWSLCMQEFNTLQNIFTGLASLQK